MYYKGKLERLRGTLFQFLPARGWWRVESVERTSTHMVETWRRHNWRLVFARHGEQRVEVWDDAKVARVVKATRGGGPNTIMFQGGNKCVVFAPVAVDATTRGYTMTFKRKKYERKQRETNV